MVIATAAVCQSPSGRGWAATGLISSIMAARGPAGSPMVGVSCGASGVPGPADGEARGGAVGSTPPLGVQAASSRAITTQTTRENLRFIAPPPE